ncbi:hypothetical protein K438DRAFT_1777454 [Mycena galopus ATCC 62051]|nr:hypothetical protein K438DRAFT_1777454 [Mycena galopus ATCC 62051]
MTAEMVILPYVAVREHPRDNALSPWDGAQVWGRVKREPMHKLSKLGGNHEDAGKFKFVVPSSAARGGVGTAEQQSPNRNPAHPNSMIIQMTAPSEGEPPAWRESKQEAPTAQLRIQA